MTSKARQLADLLDANGDVGTDALDNVPPNTALVDSSDNTVLDTSSGNVGIGTSSPAKTLHLKVPHPSTTGATLRLENGSVSNVTGTVIGEIDFYSNDADGAHVSSFIKGIAQETYGRTGALTFGVSQGLTDDATEAMRIDSSGNLKFNSGYGSAGVAYGCRAWVNFEANGTVTIQGSGNVSSITDQATGVFTVNLSTAMPDTNFGVAATAKKFSVAGLETIVVSEKRNQNRTTSAIPISTTIHNANFYDPEHVSLMVFR